MFCRWPVDKLSFDSQSYWQPDTTQLAYSLCAKTCPLQALLADAFLTQTKVQLTCNPPRSLQTYSYKMNDLFRNFVSSSVSSSSASDSSNPFIGNIVELKENQLRLEELIAEGETWHLKFCYLIYTILGGFGYVFRARDLKTSKIYALKRLIASDSESRDEIENEISMLSRVQKHKHIMEFYYCDKVKPNISFLLW